MAHTSLWMYSMPCDYITLQRWPEAQPLRQGLSGREREGQQGPNPVEDEC